ncbi:hypothetical protein COO60DRAFT_764255 [Scenedesmus sp. NREL 46B-D3]|nr:hypothetical protein COO60DRAFT_764255 [Scenedesmus sp. NREL 46B-D3]
MPRQEPLNDRVVEALENRRRKCEVLKMGKQFTYKAATDKIKAMRTNITRASHVLNLKDVPPTVKEEMVDIINGTAPVEVALPTPGELRNAARRGPSQMFQNPPAKGTGGWCILLALHNAHTNGKATLTKDQIIRWAGSHLHIAMEDGAAGFNKWSNAKRMETKCWVHRTAFSKKFGGGGTGGFGGRKDEFELTEEGSVLAAILWEQHFGAGGGPSTTAAAAAAGRQQQGHRSTPAGFGDPGTAAAARAAAASGFDAFLDQLTTGPEFVSQHGGGGGTGAGAAAGRYSAGVSPFTGRAACWEAAAAAKLVLLLVCSWQQQAVGL